MVDVEFYRDIRPILERSCISCHTQNDPDPPGALVLDDTSLYGGLPGDYKRLADDSDADWGYPPVIPNGTWRQTNASRYIREFQSRRSLLIWKLFGARLDGWTNGDHPTESVPGDSATLPPGASANEADLDFTGTIMPPPGTDPPLTEDEKMLFARWIDLGAPINSGQESGNGAFGWFLDDLRPTIALSLPRPGFNAAPVDMLRLGLADANSGIDAASLSVKADFVVEGRAAGVELADLAVAAGSDIWTIPLSGPLSELFGAHLFVEVLDLQGNVTRVDRKFSTVPAHLLSVSKDGSWTGRVTGNLGQIDCGLFCQASYAGGTAVQLTAVPDYGGEMTAWGPNCAGGSVQLDQDEACPVTFDVASCAGSSQLTLADEIVTSQQSHEACDSITAGPSYAIEDGGDVTVAARNVILLANGFSVGTGGSFEAAIDLMAGSQ